MPLALAVVAGLLSAATCPTSRSCALAQRANDRPKKRATGRNLDQRSIWLSSYEIRSNTTLPRAIHVPARRGCRRARGNKSRTGAAQSAFLALANDFLSVS